MIDLDIIQVARKLMQANNGVIHFAQRGSSKRYGKHEQIYCR